MFKSIRSKLALFLGILLTGGIAQANTVISVHAKDSSNYYVEKQLVSSKNDPYNPLILPTAELQKKLKKRWFFFKNSETQKIIDLLLADPGMHGYPRDIDIFLYFDKEIPATAKTITFHFDDGDCTITKEQYLANRQLLFSNPYIIQAVFDYTLQIKKYPGVYYYLWRITFLISEPEFRSRMTDYFIKDYLSENDDKKGYFFNENYHDIDILVDFIGELKKQNDTYNLNKLTSYLKNHVPRMYNHRFLEAIEKQ